MPGSRWRLSLALAAVATAALAFHLSDPGFFDNEGRYAEVARAMLSSEDYVIPRMDGHTFLTKPPLTFWMTTVAFRIFGQNEWARLVSVLWAGVAIFATGRLGARLYGERAGLLAGLFLATMLGFVLEARTLRPDVLLTACTVTAVLCWHHAEHGPERRRTAWLIGLWSALSVGMMAKGLPPVVAAGIPIGVDTLHRHGWRGIGRLRPGLALVVFTVIVLPWHLIVALRTPGFAWDYIVNQHLLALIGKKQPRDSVGISLGTFWGAFIARGSPWIVFVPLTIREALRSRDEAERGATIMLWAWILGLMLLFSASPSRLEHYSIPALPAVALLGARGWQRLYARHVAGAVWQAYAFVGLALVVAGVVALVAGPQLLAKAYWLPQAPGLPALTVPAGIVLLGGGALVALGATRRVAWAFLAAFLATTIPFDAVVVRAMMLVGPPFSWRSAAGALRAQIPNDTEIIFEAPVEYQIVGGLMFYVGRPVTLLEVPGYVPPAYLRSEVSQMFLPRDEFARKWQAPKPLVLVSDPQRRRDTPDGIVPGPFRVVARFGDRWVLANDVSESEGPLAAASASPPPAP